MNGQATSAAGRAPNAPSARTLSVVEGAAGASLVERHLAGDPQAFAELVESYRGPVYSYLVRSGVAAADRDDLFQDVFIRVHRAAASYDPSRPLHPWLFTVVANAVRNHLRRQRVRSLVGAADGRVEAATDQPGAERAATARQTVAWLEERIRALPVDRREVLLLACVESLPLPEVARVLGLPLGTVKTHLRRARLTLAEELARRDAPEVSS